MELCSWLQLLQESAPDNAEDRANIITLCKVVSALPVTPEHMRSSRIGHVLTSLSKASLEDVSEAASKARDVLRDRMKSLQVPGGLSKRSIACATAAPASAGAPTSQTEANPSDPPAPAAAAADGQEQAPSGPGTRRNSGDDVAPGAADTSALQERPDAAGACGTVPVSIGGTPSTVDAAHAGGKGDTPVSNGTLSQIGRIGASIIAPARKASEVIANIKRSFSSSSSGSAGSGVTGAAQSGVLGVAAGVNHTRLGRAFPAVMPRSSSL